MKIFSLKENVLALPNPQILNLLQAIELRRGQTFSLPHLKNVNRLHVLSKRRSTTSSNAIEGIRVTPKREADLLSLGMKPEAYEEFMLTGYNAALERVLASFSYQELDERFILDLHALMYQGYNPAFGGKWKDTQNYITQDDGKGNKALLFTPSKPEDVPALMGNLVWQYNACLQDPEVNRLLLIPVFILDFLCVHPFNDGNGRMSRLLTSFLLLKDDYDVDLYYSLSYLILARQEDYYQALYNSTQLWKEDKNDYSYFAIYLLQIILEGYERLDKMVELASWKAPAEDKVVKAIMDSPTPLSKAELEELLFSLSKTTIEKALGDALKSEKIRMIQSGHYAKYYRK
jgi:Fic family protein